MYVRVCMYVNTHNSNPEAPELNILTSYTYSFGDARLISHHTKALNPGNTPGKSLKVNNTG